MVQMQLCAIKVCVFLLLEQNKMTKTVWETQVASR